MDIDIVYEDDDIMIINKASGVVVHPGAGNHDNTLVNGLYYYTKKLYFYLHLTHAPNLSFSINYD